MLKSLRKAVLPLLLAVSLAPQANAQDRANEATVILSNAIIHGIVAGVGAANHEQNFFEGFAKGCAGGALVGVGKYWVGEEVNGAWGAKMLTSLGTSVTYNVAGGRDAFAAIMFDLGPVMVTYDGEKGFKPYLLPKACFDLVRTVADGYRFDPAESLKRGTPIFQGGTMPGVHGFARSNVLVIEDHDPRLTQTTRHELVHSHQYLQSFIFNPLFEDIPLVRDAFAFSERYHVMPDFNNYALTKLQQGIWTHDARPIEIEAATFAKPTRLEDIFP